MLGFKVKKLEFNPKPVLSAEEKTTRRVFGRFGGRVRKLIVSRVPKRKAISAAGDPPHSHVGLFKRFIRYAFDPAARSVVIGPELINKPQEHALVALEYGGSFQRVDRHGKTFTATYEPRPVTTPAFDEEKKNIQSLYADALKG